MPEITLMVGPPGSGKSTYAKNTVYLNNMNGQETVYINQDSQGKDGHWKLFEQALKDGKSVVVDRLNFNVQQREKYLNPAKKLGYRTEIVVLHENMQTCFKRCIERQGHETITAPEHASAALNMFFSKYEPVQNSEADDVIRIWPEGDKPLALIVDLDGTLCDTSKRAHYVNRPNGDKKDWNSFFKEMVNDNPSIQVMETVRLFSEKYKIVYCSGRPDSYRPQTETWLKQHSAPEGSLFMRNRKDMRDDSIVKKNILDFELKTRYSVFLCLDDRDRVIKMWRDEGLVAFQVAPGSF